MPSRSVDLGTIQEWRDLGFFYDVNESEMTWTLRGDRKGLLGFAKRLREYSRDTKNQSTGEHEHFGPYFYLTIMTGQVPAIDESGWTGTSDDFVKLAALIEGYLANPAQTEFVIGKEFAPHTPFTIIFRIEDDGFDPSSADPLIQHRS